jgi:D-alanyl-D-alanine carboxypeptidase
MIGRIVSAWGAAILCLALIASAQDTASARAAKVRHRPAAAKVEKDAAIVVDGVSGRVLYSRNADAPRIPASLTKMMTLYLLFGELDEGNITLTSKLTMSSYAAKQEPTKLGANPGEQIDVETAIKAITVLSANDVAVMIAENIGKSEKAFAKRMNDKARELGMTNTHFDNASGLPDPDQHTTARDMALLGRHLAYDFPQYYGYFSTPSFAYDGRIYDNHDHLLGSFDGVDGIKTGYTRASGFNLVTSVVRNNKHIVGVVMGGTTYSSRDHEMVRLLSSAFDFAQSNPAMLADANPPWRGGKGPASDPFGTAKGNVQVASLDLDPPQPVPAPAAKPVVIAVVPKPKPVLGLANVTLPVPKPEIAHAVLVAKADAPASKPAALTPVPKPQVPDTVVASAALPVAAPVARIPFAPGYVPPPTATAQREVHIALASSTPATARERPQAPPRVLQGDITGFSSLLFTAAKAGPRLARHWTVQIGAYASESIAKAELASYAQLSTETLGQAEQFITPFASFDGHKLYRARFGTFAEDEARSICSAMIRQGQQCFATSQLN